MGRWGRESIHGEGFAGGGGAPELARPEFGRDYLKTCAGQRLQLGASVLTRNGLIGQYFIP